MKSYEKQLLNKMHYEEVNSNNEPLKNVKEALGKIQFIKGNPLTKTEIKLNVRLNFFKNKLPITTAQLPANLRGQFPVLLFGLTDFYSGFPKSILNIPLSEPWVDNLNFSYREGKELIDQNNWHNAAYWDVIPPQFTFAGDWIHDEADGTVLAQLVKNNFSWVPGQMYKITYTFFNEFHTPDVFEIGFFDGITYFQANSWTEYLPPAIPSPALSIPQQSVSYYFIPTSTNLVFLSGLEFVGDKIDIVGLSIKEVYGSVEYPSDNSMGIYGYNKSTVLSDDVEKGDLVQTFNFVNSYQTSRPGVSSARFIDVYTAEVIVHCNNVAFGTFLNSFVSDLISINTLRYIVPIANIDQLINPLKFGYQTLFGKTFTDDIDPRNFITNKDFQQQISDIPINLPIDKQVMLGTNINYNCPTFDMILFVEKVEPLTHK